MLKSQTRQVKLLDFGELIFIETVKYCPECLSKFFSEKLSELVPDYANFGFEIIEFIGRKIFIDCYTEKEVLIALKERNIKISLAEVSFLAEKFILYLAQAHKEKETEVKGLIQKNGGYIVHLDGTCDGASPHLFCAVEELLKLVLLSRKIPSESTDEIAPILKELKAAYGVPLGVVCDMSKAIISAIQRIFPGIRIFICHFHFLRDIGKNFLKNDHDLFVARLRDFGAKTTLSKFSRELKGLIKNHTSLSEYLESNKTNIFDQELPEEVLAHLLIEWIQDYKSDLAGYGYPFDRAHLAQVKRMEDAYEHLKKITLKSSDRLLKIRDFLEEVLSDSYIKKCLKNLKKKVRHFDRLRAIMRLAPQDGKNGLNDDGDEVDMPEMKKELEKFINMEEIQSEKTKDIGYKKILTQIAKYKDKLFTEGITVTGAKGKKSCIHPERTNNMLERLFRGEKRGVRKRTGCKSMSQALKTMIAETPYVKNLENPEYLEVILNGKKTLAERFAEMNSKQIRVAMKKHHEDQDRLKPCVKKALEDDDLLLSVFKAYSDRD